MSRVALWLSEQRLAIQLFLGESGSSGAAVVSSQQHSSSKLGRGRSYLIDALVWLHKPLLQECTKKEAQRSWAAAAAEPRAP